MSFFNRLHFCSSHYSDAYSVISRISDHSESLDAAVLDCAEEEPGRAVEQSEDPAADDDTPGPCQGTNVLEEG